MPALGTPTKAQCCGWLILLAKVSLTCGDVISDLCNGISLLIDSAAETKPGLEEKERADELKRKSRELPSGIVILVVTWMPGVFYSVKRLGYTREALLDTITFPAMILFHGCKSLLGFLCRSTEEDRSRQKFLDMKNHEMLIESVPQLAINIFLVGLVFDYSDMPIIQHASFAFSLWSVLFGIFGRTAEICKHQKEHVQNIGMAGRILVTLILTRFPFFMHTVICWLHVIKRFKSRPIEILTYTLVLPTVVTMLSVMQEFVQFVREIVFFLQPTRQRRTKHTQMDGRLTKIGFFLVMPVFVDLTHSRIYRLHFVLTKLGLLTMSTACQTYFFYLDLTFHKDENKGLVSWFNISACLYLFLIIANIVNFVLNCVYLSDPDWFYTASSHDDAARKEGVHPEQRNNKNAFKRWPQMGSGNGKNDWKE